jgi:hypothetical protein
MPIKLELSASVGFIHKESITMHGHTVLKFVMLLFNFLYYAFLLLCLCILILTCVPF